MGSRHAQPSLDQLLVPDALLTTLWAAHLRGFTSTIAAAERGINYLVKAACQSRLTGGN